MIAPAVRGRTATVVLCSPAGELLGALPPVETTLPWWQEAQDVVAAVKAAHAIDVTILRLLSTSGSQPGGSVTYLAELAEPERITRSTRIAGVTPWNGPDPIADHPLRMPWARPGGPATELAWAEAALHAAGRRRTGAPVQMRTWNLSAIWRIPTDRGDAWLKCVPPFFAHEGAVIDRLADLTATAGLDAITPPLIARDGHRILMADIPGEDQYEAPPELTATMVEKLIELQGALAQPQLIAEFLAMGLPDWRGEALLARAAGAVEQYGDALPPAEHAAVEAILAGWSERYAAIESCGLPDTVVHGDFHPGNVRGAPGRLTILDWGDSGVGQPMLDQPAMLDRARETARASLAERWAGLWRAALPGSEPSRAAQLLRPVAALRQASIYTGFLAAIEPDERVYHADDPLIWLHRAAVGA